MMASFWKILCALVIFLVSTVNSAPGISCITPNNQTGICTIDTDCDSYQEAHEKYFYENCEYFRQLQCNYDGFHPTICCPINGIFDVIKLDLPTTIKVRENHTADLVNRFDTETLFPGKDICGVQVYGNKIFNGEVADIDEFPWMALLFYETEVGVLQNGCGGVLINEKYVLTAAHCVTGIVKTVYGGIKKIRLGEYNIATEVDCVIDVGFSDCADPAVDFLPEEIIPFPDFDPDSKDLHHDIALIRLQGKAVYSDFIKPICLPEYYQFPNYNFTVGSRLFVAGWGRTETGFSSPVKLKLKVPIYNHTECENVYHKYNITITPCQLCAGGELEKDSCKGDSGGPLMGEDPETGNWITSGIVSIGPDACGKFGVPGVYTSVKEYMCWITETVKP